MRIEILGARYSDQLDLNLLCKNVARVFKLEVSFRKIVLDFGIAFEPNRLQYYSTKLLEVALNSGKLNDKNKYIILTDLDLYIPILTYVFGEAELNGSIAIASSYRLHNDYYGLPKNKQMLQSRIEKEIIHELGHTFGLIHCSDSSCVMHSSSYVEEIDLKSSEFCLICRQIIVLDKITIK